jgi:hypothetical protein
MSRREQLIIALTVLAGLIFGTLLSLIQRGS